MLLVIKLNKCVSYINKNILSSLFFLSSHFSKPSSHCVSQIWLMEQTKEVSMAAVRSMKLIRNCKVGWTMDVKYFSISFSPWNNPEFKSSRKKSTCCQRVDLSQNLSCYRTTIVHKSWLMHKVSRRIWWQHRRAIYDTQLYLLGPTSYQLWIDDLNTCFSFFPRRYRACSSEFKEGAWSRRRIVNVLLSATCLRMEKVAICFTRDEVSMRRYCVFFNVPNFK